MMRHITPLEAYNRLQADEVFVIDVREQEEFDQCRIEGTILVPLSQLPEKITDVDIPDDKTLIFHCLKGGRSADAILYLEQNLLKDRDVYNMEGGILAWIEEDLPVVTGLK